MQDLNDLLRIMVEKQASDLHLRVGSQPLYRVHGSLTRFGEERISMDWLSPVIDRVLSARQREILEKELAVDSSYSIESFTRFRINVFYQRGTLALAFRNIFTAVPTFESLDLPSVLGSICDKPQGLVLACGPTGMGKSSTLAAMIQHINETRAAHIVTIEDPIEYLMRDKKSFITQREIGLDTVNYSMALKNAMRQDPDVILIGEMRDADTMLTALSAAETGHLVFSTLHSNSSYEAISRIVDSFDVEVRPQIRKQLAETLLATTYQRLIPLRDGTGRAAAMEVLIKTPRIKDLIEGNKIREIRDEMERSVSVHRMQSFEQSLIALIANKRVAFKDALTYTLLPGELRLMMDKLGINENGDFELKGSFSDDGISF
ncbi:MAG: PilT/PilU family type 4a pilus ATPase [Deltaproteobacteria bacterium]|nr:PilT/PilU family type 4a pilus ATPase [Deltaproteobacteria bacterium]